MRKTKQQKGFTLSELLVAILILGLLATIGVVSVAQSQKNLKQIDLDSKAKELYLIAQDNLTQLFASGDMEKVKSNVSTSVEPSDYQGDNFDHLSVINSDSELASNILPVLQANYPGNWTVEFDYESAMIYACFYSEDKNNNEYYANQISVNSYLRTSKKTRTAYGNTVGYYGGNNIFSNADSKTGQMQCNIEIQNGEQLKARFICHIDSEHASDNVTFHISILGQSSGFEYKEDIVTDHLNYDETDREYTILLDDLNNSFNNLFCQDENELIPGENLIISLTCESESVSLPDCSYTTTCNSLFNSYDEVHHVARVSCGRHLQNLDVTTSNLRIMTTDVVQTSDINFDSDAWHQVYENKKFSCITNDMLATYDGNGFSIISINANRTNENAGLFRSFNGSKIEDLTMVDCIFYGTKYVGSLVGHSTNDLSIINCGAYLYPSKAANASASSTHYITGSYAGGLVGYCDEIISITNSFAAVTVEGNSYAGGLVAYSGDNANIEGCYASNYINGSNVGGLISNCAEDVVILNCYVAGAIDQSSARVAAIALCDTMQISNCYSVMNISRGGTTYSTAHSITNASNVYYAHSGSVNLSNTTYKNSSAMRDVATMAASLSTKFASETYSNAVPYKNNIDEVEKIYPYPALKGLRVYGDWD